MLLVTSAGQQVDFTTMETHTVLQLQDREGRSMVIRISEEDLSTLIEFAALSSGSGQSPSEEEQQEYEPPPPPTPIRRAAPAEAPPARRAKARPREDEDPDWADSSWANSRRTMTTTFGDDDGTLSDT